MYQYEQLGNGWAGQWTALFYPSSISFFSRSASSKTVPEQIQESGGWQLREKTETKSSWCVLGIAYYITIG